MTAPDPLLFALDGATTLGPAVAREIGIDCAPLELRVFTDGEHKLRPLRSVAGASVVVLQQLHADARASLNDRLVQTLFFVSTLKDAGASRVTLAVPYLPYARKDRRTKPQDPLSLRYLAQWIEVSGCDAVLCVEAHNLAAAQNAFRVRFEALAMTPLWVRWLGDQCDGPLTLVAPDVGGMKRVDALARALGRRRSGPVTTALVEKRRSGGKLSGTRLLGEVCGTAVVVDDMLASGATMVRAAEAALAAGADRVWALATHGLFTGDAPLLLERAPIDRVLVTNSLPLERLKDSPIARRVEVVDLAPDVAAAAVRLSLGSGVDALGIDSED